MVSLKRKHPITQRIYKVLLEKKFDGTWINRIIAEDDVLKANIHLPEHKERSDLEKILPNLQQELGATAIKFGKMDGKSIELLFGMRELDKMEFSSSLLHMDTLQVEFPSAYGKNIIDFEDGASTHLLNGGATRMGKTVFLLYLSTAIFLQQKGHMKLYIASVKLKDFYPFNGIPQVKMARDDGELLDLLHEIEEEYERRDDLLYSPKLAKATDAKSVRELYPDYYPSFQPIFLIIDEYAQFAENRKVQEKVTMLVEKAGFVNVHVIIASQRPDVQTVLKPRIRANLMVRVSFSTVDAKNSMIILDKEGAESLGMKQGRALLRDSDITMIQVPYLDVVKCDELLEPYRKDVPHVKNETRSIDSTVSDKIQSLLSESTSLPDLSGELESHECREQSLETIIRGWTNPSDTERT